MASLPKLAEKETDVPHERNVPRIACSSKYVEFFMNLGIRDNLIYVDEYGYNVFTRRSGGRALRRQRVQGQISGSRGRNVELILAISHWERIIK